MNPLVDPFNKLKAFIHYDAGICHHRQGGGASNKFMLHMYCENTQSVLAARGLNYKRFSVNN